MFCPKCGSRLPDDAAFCGSCGIRIMIPQDLNGKKKADPGAAPPAAEPCEQDYSARQEDAQDHRGKELPGSGSSGEKRRSGKKSGGRKKSFLPLLMIFLLAILAGSSFLLLQAWRNRGVHQDGTPLQAADEPLVTEQSTVPVLPQETTAALSSSAGAAQEETAPAAGDPAAADGETGVPDVPKDSLAADTPSAAPTAAAASAPAAPAPTRAPEPSPSRLSPLQITATSTLGYDGDNYFPEYVNDDYPVSAWAEGAEGNGEGQSLFFTFPAGTKITGGEILPGFYKNEDLFSKNSAPVSLQISSGGQTSVLDVSEYANSWHGASSLQSFALGSPIICDGTLTVTIQSVRPGWKFTDTLISELHFFGVPAEYVQSAPASQSAAAGADAGEPAGETRDTVRQEGGGISGTVPDETSISKMASMAGWVYRHHMGQNGLQDADIRESDLLAEENAFLLYWYQYQCGDLDSRIQSQMEYNLASDGDLRTMMAELFGTAYDDAMEAFYSAYVLRQEGNICYMNGTGDFGDAGPFYFGDGQLTEEDGRVCISGSVMAYDSGAGSYVPAKTYRAYYSSANGGTGNPCIPYPFLEVTVGS